MGSLSRSASRILIFAFFAMIVLIAPSIMMRTYVSRYVYADMDALPHADAAMVLGASVVRGAPSPILAARADIAIRLYQEGKVDAILDTGDNGAKNYDEVTPVRQYLQNAGIPESAIALDDAGFDTYSSMYRARTVYLARTLTIVTQDFHLARAVFIARMLGVQAYGIAGVSGGSVFDYVREVPASWKALWDLATHRTPKYLGTPTPIPNPGIASR